MNTVRIAIHESKSSQKVVRFLELNDFSYAFQDAYNNGMIYGAYYTKSGKVNATTTDGDVVRNVAK
jgi:hypothetical protein